MKVVALAGGVGGAKLAEGLAKALDSADLTVIVNTGDDFSHYGLQISPDLDTVCYTLAGLSNPSTGWGREGETWSVLEGLVQLGGPGWFRLGDRDLATHLERTRRLSAGEALSRITHDFCKGWGVRVRVLPMTDDRMETWVDTAEMGWLPFQEYFVQQLCKPRVQGFEFRGCDSAHAAPGVLEAIGKADCVVFCPSNPWVSIKPILTVNGIADEISRRRIRIAVSPIIGGNALKGPAAKMYTELGIAPSALAVAQQYSGIINGFVMDELDRSYFEDVKALGMNVLVTNTTMSTSDDRERLAKEVINFSGIFDRQENVL
jgi:LPPG:FO 2-phospho-L-lactate transferase